MKQVKRELTVPMAVVLLGLSVGTGLAAPIAEGTVIGVVGTLGGVILGVLLSLNLENIVAFMEAIFGIKFLAADVYFISDLPADLRIKDVLQISAIALVLALASTLYPAWRGARTLPAEALRYE